MTAREERDNERKKEAQQRAKEAALQKNKQAAVEKYDSQTRPTLPTSKAERRSLRKGLAERGEGFETFHATTKPSFVLPPSEVTGEQAGDKRIQAYDDDDDWS